MGDLCCFCYSVAGESYRWPTFLRTSPELQGHQAHQLAFRLIESSCQDTLRIGLEVLIEGRSPWGRKRGLTG